MAAETYLKGMLLNVKYCGRRRYSVLDTWNFDCTTAARLKDADLLSGLGVGATLACEHRHARRKMISEISCLSCNDLKGLRLPTVLCYVLYLSFVGGSSTHTRFRQFPTICSLRNDSEINSPEQQAPCGKPLRKPDATSSVT